ncbi:membrane protein [Microbacterium phage CandC]|nr:membrane protein [Microbacterium phage CandC]
MTDRSTRIQLNGWGGLVTYLGFVAVAVVLIIGAFIGSAITEPSPNPPALPACATEDSDNCWWDATKQGNGAGLSFVVIEGEVTYLAPANR